MPTEVQNNWEECLAKIRSQISEQVFATWIKPMAVLQFDDQKIVFQVSSRFFADFIERNYLTVIEAAVFDVTQTRPSVHFKVISEEVEFSVRPEVARTESREVNQEINNYKKQLNERYTFETFVVGNSNQFAHSAALAVAEAPGKTSFNPLVIYGPTGLGKTHLLQGIGHYALDEKIATKVKFITAEQFTNDYVSALSINAVGEFTNFYKNVDVLLMDDIHSLIGKEGTQVQFFHIFNTLHQNGRQIVLTSDRPVKELKGELEERLTSRFQWGLVVDIQPPDLETRIAILQKNAERNGITLSQEVIHFIASHVTTNIRMLEGSLVRLLAYYSLNKSKGEISLDIVRNILRDFIEDKGNRKITIDLILEKVANYYSLSGDNIRAKLRTKEVALARHICMYLAKHLTTLSLKAIGLQIGRRDHSTVIHACGQIEHFMKTEPQIKNDINNIINEIEGKV